MPLNYTKTIIKKKLCGRNILYRGEKKQTVKWKQQQQVLSKTKLYDVKRYTRIWEPYWRERDEQYLSIFFIFNIICKVFYEALQCCNNIEKSTHCKIGWKMVFKMQQRKA